MWGEFGCCVLESTRGRISQRSNLKSRLTNEMLTKSPVGDFRSLSLIPCVAGVLRRVATKGRGLGRFCNGKTGGLFVAKSPQAPLSFVAFSLLLSLSSGQIQYGAQTDVSLESTRTACYSAMSLTTFDDQPGINSRKKLQVRLTSRTLAFTSAHSIQVFTSSRYKPPTCTLIQWHFVKFTFSSRTLDAIQYRKNTLYWIDKISRKDSRFKAREMRGLFFKESCFVTCYMQQNQYCGCKQRHSGRRSSYWAWNLWEEPRVVHGMYCGKLHWVA